MTISTTKQLRLRRGTTSEHGNFIGAPGEITVDTDLNTIRVHDGVTPAGHLVRSTGTAIVSWADVINKPTIPTDISQLTDNDSLLGADRLVNGPHQLVLNVSGAGPYVTFPTDDGVHIGIQGGEIAAIGDEIILTSAESAVRLSANAAGNRKDWLFGIDGGITFPPLEVDLHNGGVQIGQVLQFGESGRQAIITGPTPPNNANAERLVIQGQRATGTGEGGDVYLWAGDSQINGGDIKIYAGDADGVTAGYGGYVNIDGGYGLTQGGHVLITGGSSNTISGNLTLRAGQGGDHGSVYVSTYGHQWTFDANGVLTLPAGGDILDSTGASVLGGGGTTLPADASGYLVNDGTGALSWAAGDGTFSGDYDDLTNKPALFSGDYDDLTDKPTIPTSFSSLVNGSYTASLGTDGNLTAPGNLQVDGGKIILHPYGNAYVESVDYGVNSANSAVNIFGGPYQKIKIRAGFGTEATWTFATDGTTTFPSNSIKNSLDNSTAITTQRTLTANNTYTNVTDFSTDVDLGGGLGVIAGWYQRTVEQIEFALFGPSAFISYLTGLALGRTVIVTYSTAGGNQTLTRTLTQAFSGTGQTDPNNPSWGRVSGRINATLPVGQLGIVSINFPVYSTDTNDWTFATDGAITFPDGTTTSGKGITLPVNQSLTVNTSYSAGPGGVTTFKINPESIKLPTGNGTIFSGTETVANAWHLDSANKTLFFPDAGDGVFPQIKYSTTGNDGMQLFTAAKPIKITVEPNNWTFGTDGHLTLPAGGDIVDSTGASVLGSGPTNEITNTDGNNIWSVSVGTDGVVTMNTIRGGIEFGAMPEVGGPNHLHIMRPAGAEGATDLYFGDDYNYVKMPALYGAGTQGVEIGSSYNSGTVSTWRFGTDGHLTLPAGGDIKDSTGTSVLGGGGSANTGNITFSGDYMTGTDGQIRMRTLNVNQTASYNFTPGNSDYSTAVWDGTGITFNDPTQAIYDAIWALTNFSTIEVQVGSTWFTVTSSGSSTPGMPQAPTLWLNETAVGGPLNIDVVDITINQGTESYAEIDGTDFEVDVQDDIRMYANDTFLLSNRSSSDPIRIETNDGSNQWSFNSDGDLILPDSGDIKDDNGNSLLFSGSYNDLSDTPSLFGGDYDDLNNKPTIRIAVATGGGPGGNNQADSLALAGLNPVTDIPSTWGGDLILQGGVGGANGDLYGEVRIKSGQIGANYEWHFTTDKKIKLPAGGNIVDSTGATAFVSLATLKQVVSDSTDFADFKSRIAGM